MLLPGRLHQPTFCCIIACIQHKPLKRGVGRYPRAGRGGGGQRPWPQRLAGLAGGPRPPSSAYRSSRHKIQDGAALIRRSPQHGVTGESTACEQPLSQGAVLSFLHSLELCKDLSSGTFGGSGHTVSHPESLMALHSATPRTASSAAGIMRPTAAASSLRSAASFAAPGGLQLRSPSSPSQTAGDWGGQETPGTLR